MDFDVLKGKTIKRIDGMEKGSNEVVFITTDNETYKMYHQQDCCESVQVEEVHGDVKDLIKSPILLAEAVVNPEGAPVIEDPYENSNTWTFYKLSTIKGSITVRWLGSSNGCYSESVDFEKVKDLT